jgi:hypothetical protein
MNFFRNFFGQRTIPEASVAHQPAVNRYVALTIETVGFSTSVDELRLYARDYSGYVREAALNRCVELGWPELLPLVAERLNDWVPEVRHMARKALMTLLPLVAASQILAVVPVILRLNSGGRGDHVVWLTQFEAELIQTVCVEEFVAAATGPDIKWLVHPCTCSNSISCSKQAR